MGKSEDRPWKEIGIAVDEASGIAALVSIHETETHPIPAIQLGTLIGPEKKFSPHLHPHVSWHGKHGSVEPGHIAEIPQALRHKISEMLKTHLEKRSSEPLSDLLRFELVSGEKGPAAGGVLRCLSCS
jgi:hypothetical protein